MSRPPWPAEPVASVGTDPFERKALTRWAGNVDLTTQPARSVAGQRTRPPGVRRAGLQSGLQSGLCSGLWRDVWSVLRSGGRTHGRAFGLASGIGAGATGIGLLLAPKVTTATAAVAAIGLLGSPALCRWTRWGRRLAASWGRCLRLEQAEHVPGFWEAVPDDWQDNGSELVPADDVPGRRRAAGPVRACDVDVTVSVVARDRSNQRPAVAGRGRALPASPSEASTIDDLLRSGAFAPAASWTRPATAGHNPERVPR